MEFRILGPLDVRVDGRAVDPGAGKPRALLAILLLDANRVVSADVLVESLWGERPPTTATKALQVYVSQLRKTLGRDRIVTVSPGYELRLEQDELDLHRFERLASEGRYDEALGLWRGAPLAEFAYEPFAQSEIARLDELWISTLESRIDRDLAEGRHAALVAELDALVLQFPLRERIRGQLMLALYRSGRQADALEAYRVGRTLLSDELGLEPGADLRELQRAILAQDPALDAPRRPGPADEPAPVPDPAAPPSRVREARKTVTVLVVDLRPARNGLDPEPVRRLAARGYDELVPVLEGHGATVERSLGGSVTAVFGIPSVHEDDPMRAVRAAADARDRLAELGAEFEEAWGAGLELSAGLSTGEVITGGDGDRLTATGKPVRTAIELLQAAAPGEILLDARTLRVVRDAVDVELDGEVARLRAVAPVESHQPIRYDAPMVGRERERRRLQDAFDQAVGDRSCQLFTILGVPGVGKSRLVHEFVATASETALVVRGRCLPYGEGISYWPVLEALRDLVELDDTAPPSESLARLRDVLADAPEVERNSERLGEILGLSDRTSSADEIAAAVLILVESLARQRPLVVVFDDIHWGEATFLDLVDAIADDLSDVPVLLVCIARPELLDVRPGWGGGKLNATSVLLEALSEDESEALLDALSGSDALDAAARQRIVEAAGGNPLFVEEMLALLLEGESGGDALDIPPTIHALLATRLERLPDGEREAIEAASVEGKVFHVASVARLTSSEPDAAGATLLGLVRRGLVRAEPPVFSGEQAFRFRHLLIRDAAYESIPKEARATLHTLHAEWLVDEVGDRTLELDEIVGYHYEQAYRYRSDLGPVDDATREIGRAAAVRLGAAGRRALLRSDGPAGVNLISRSAALLAADDPLRVQLVPSVRVIQGLADLSWADRVLTEAVEAAATTGDRSVAAHALVQRGFLRLFADEGVTVHELLEVAERAIAVFDTLGDELGLARAWRLVAQAHYLDRRAAACVDASERALEHVRRAGDPFEEREIVEWLVIALFLGPEPAPSALARCRELLAEEQADPLLAAEVMGAAAALTAMQGDRAEAAELKERAQAAMRAADEWIWILTFWYSFIELWSGDPAGAEAELRPGYEALKKIGEKSHFSSIAHGLASATYELGRYDEAEQLTYECEAACHANDVHSQVLFRSIRAKILARRGELEAAEALARAGVAYAEPSDFLQAHADALTDLGEVLAFAGRREEAAAAIREAIALGERKGNLLAVEACRKRLGRLEG